MSSPVSRALSAPKYKTYLMGWAAGIVYHDGFDWLLNKGDGWCDLCGRTEEDSAWIYPTKEEAISAVKRHFVMARKIAAQYKVPYKPFPGFVRGYLYETPNPKNAEGMPEIDRNEAQSLREEVLDEVN